MYICITIGLRKKISEKQTVRDIKEIHQKEIYFMKTFISIKTKRKRDKGIK